MVVQSQSPMDRYEDWLKNAGLDKKPIRFRVWTFALEEATKKPYGVNGVIIDVELGLGKTILTLGCMAVNPTNSNGLSQNLVVVPPALLTQWSKIIKNFMGFRPLIYHGYGTKHISDDELAAAPIVLTTYGMIAARKKELSMGCGKPIGYGLLWMRRICSI